MAEDEDPKTRIHAPGQTVRHYELLDEIGRGGMGIVYRARDRDLPREVALKRPLPEFLDSGDLRRRFLREGRAASRISHPNIVPVLEAFEENGVPWIVFQLVEGVSLRDLLAREGKLPLATALTYAEELASGLQAAHDHGVVHRDVNPKNILVDSSGRALLTDFGLARLMAGSQEMGSGATDTVGVTSTGAVMGTPRYMAPEQILGRPVDARTDIFALGAVLYEICAGAPAFQSTSQTGLAGEILHREPLPIGRYSYEVPGELERIIRKCLAKQPEERYQSARELIADLRTVHKQVEFREYSETHPQRLPLKPHRLRRLGFLTAGALALAAAGFALWRFLPTRDASLPFARARPIQVTSFDSWESEPALSPDGGRVAYVSDISGNLDLYAIGVTGGSPIALTDHAASDRSPAWLPDGSAVLFVSNRLGADGVWKTGQLGGPPTLVLENARDPAVSPDGRLLAFAREDSSGATRVLVTSLEDPGQATDLTGPGHGLWAQRQPAWSPDGKRICYAAYDGLWQVPSGGGRPQRILAGSDMDQEPCWSPDGRRIYFASYRGGNLALWSVPATGGEPQRVTMGAASETHPSLAGEGKRLAYCTQGVEYRMVLRDMAGGAESVLPGFRHDWMPSLSPAGDALVFVSDRWGAELDLWLQPLVDGRPHGEPLRLTDHPGSASHPAVSPDGKWIAYYRILEEERDIWMLPIEGGSPRRFTAEPGPDIHPAWSPDGGSIAYSSERGGSACIWIQGVADGTPRGIPLALSGSGPSAQAPAWSPDGGSIAYTASLDGGTEVFVIAVDPSAAPRAVTRGAGASRVRWDPEGRALFVSGSWGSMERTLKRVSLEDGSVRPIDPPVLFGSRDPAGFFDVARDGRSLVWCSEVKDGDIWVLDATAERR